MMPVKTRAFGPGRVYLVRWASSSGTRAAGIATVRTPARDLVHLPVGLFGVGDADSDESVLEVEVLAVQRRDLTPAERGERGEQDQGAKTVIGRVVGPPLVHQSEQEGCSRLTGGKGLGVGPYSLAGDAVSEPVAVRGLADVADWTAADETGDGEDLFDGEDRPTPRRSPAPPGPCRRPPPTGRP